KKYLSDAVISGCDVSIDALDVAEKNKEVLGLDVSFFNCDILKEEIEEEYDYIISNPPYIAEKEKSTMHVNVLNHEPHLALFVKDQDPLLFYKRIVALAEKQSATCFFETSEFYRESLDLWLEGLNLRFEWKLDFQGKDRILKVYT
ncbi:MAG: methyltransferase, partial [Bacteroidia bacterium]